MSLFLLTFFLIYGGVHCYAFLKVRAAFAPGPAASVCLALFLLFMVIAPLLVRLFERGGLETAACVLSWLGYCWMGLLFLFFCISLTIDVLRFLLYLANIFTHRHLYIPYLSDRNTLLAAFAGAFCIAVYGYFEALDVRTERIVITSDKITAAIGRLTIVQISDVHLGFIVRKERLQRIIREIRKVNPDIIVSTGDLVDGQIDSLAELADGLRDVQPKYGKYAVTGNHEYFAGIEQALAFTRKAGFVVLRSEIAQVAGITIAGVDDPIGRRLVGEHPVEERELLGRLPRERFTLFLKHRPVVARDGIGLFDLQLSGHIHKGQIFPFNLVTHYFFPVPTGFSLLPESSALYVSRGTGTWGPPIRFLAPPEVTVLELVHESGERRQ